MTLSRPNLDVLNLFRVTDYTIGCFTSPWELIKIEEITGLQIWLNNFIKSASKIIHDLPNLIEKQKIITSLFLAKTKNKEDVNNRKIMVNEHNNQLFSEFLNYEKP